MKFEANDPRAKGFNYGAPLPVPAALTPFSRLADKWRKHNSQKGRERSWDLDMAVRFVRVACTEREQANALAYLQHNYGRFI